MTAFLESWGTGVSRMVEACKAVGLPEPEYGTDGAFVWITFKRPNSITQEQYLEVWDQKTTQKLSKKQEEIFVFLKNNPKASRKDITENISGLTEDGVKYNLKRLKELELIRRVGPDKGGFWEIIE